MTDTLTIEKIADQLNELRACEGIGTRQSGLYDRFQDAATTIEKFLKRAEEAETEATGLHMQVEAMTQINMALARQFAAAVAERGRLRGIVVKAAKGIEAARALIDESNGVYGLHLNGDLSTWQELRTGGAYEEWLADLDAAFDDPEISALMEESHHG